MFDAAHHRFADRLRACRRAAGLNQRELADLAGISVATVRDLEQARSLRPHPRSVRALRQALGTALTDEASAPAPQRPHRNPSPGPAIGILGPLLVRAGLTSARQRTVLARLALSAGAPVRAAELIDLLWGGAAPESAQRLLQTYLRRLRRLLEREGVRIELSPPGGYRLRLEREQLDLLRFRALVADAAALVADARTAQPRPAARTPQPRTPGAPTARGAAAPTPLPRPAARGAAAPTPQPRTPDAPTAQAGTPDARPAEATPRREKALEVLGAALALWRGGLLEDLPALAAHPLAVTLADEQIAAALTHADLAAELGRPAASLPVLRELTRHHPLHEAVAARLMLALSRNGQSAAALAVYDELRDRLAEELGVAPGAELAESRNEVLRQDAPFAPIVGQGHVTARP
jgi:DNA-binding SARP family transcriptional activator